MKPLVSLVINNHDYGRFVGAAVESALAQTYRPIEVIAVDDGSTDESWDVLSRYGDRITLARQANGGQAAAINLGFALSRGELVIFLDADDRLTVRAASAAAAHVTPEVVNVQWPLRLEDERGRRLGQLPTGALADGDLRPRLLAEGPLSWPSAPMSGNAWARPFLESVLPMPEAGYRTGADSYLNAMAPLYGRTAALPRALGTQIRHSANDSSQPIDEYLSACLVRWRLDSGAVASHLRAHGDRVDVRDWEATNSHVRSMARGLTVAQAAARFTGSGATILLIDGGVWGDNPLAAGRSTRRLPVHARGDERLAVAWVRRRVKDGASVLLIAWPAFEWLEIHPQFRTYLRSFPSLMTTDDAWVWDLVGNRSSPPNGRGRPVQGRREARN
jgi:glycosyltransferase involved in cell wall biosynthesis